ncbi:MAG: DUF4998 domain-containing protein [Candidatus Pedobacter colombiensis]|uniref:DUF4998 domain-containing protein n=1 Tax=Candidatus Pedobacter colombiensis TaxID=3121371 RepID=A0AAJ5W6V2_9SPHI|nr:DUF4998 domain-containing protein [Pedobacter sp.]WEK17637.1 MAG: DUF4998 domain-containing protein [Pedobacter sp.]
MNMKRYFKYSILIAIVGSIFTSCEKMEDTYGEFVKGGEIIYSGKPDSLRALSGNKRIKLTWQLTSDPKIVKAKIFWNNRANNIEMPINKSTGVDYLSLIVPDLNEGIYTFEVFTYDKQGNASIRTEVIGESFGQIYQDNINNRALNTATWLNIPANANASPPVVAFKGVEIQWFGVSTQAVVMEIKYVNESNEKLTVIEVPVKNGDKPAQFRPATRLPGYKKGTEFTYRTGYKPNIAAIDTFYTAYSKVLVP